MLSTSISPNITSPQQLLPGITVLRDWFCTAKKVLHYQKNDIIFSGQLERRMYLLKEGRMKVGATQTSGKVIIQDIMNEGEVVGGFTNGAVRSNTFVQVVSYQAQLIAIRHQEFANLPGCVKEHIFRMVNRRIRRLERHLESRQEKETMHRVVDLLCQWGHQFGRRVGAETKVDTGLTHAEMADLAGTTRQTMTSCLAQLRRQNLINYNRRYILIRDLAALEAINAQEKIALN
ncbi:MAG: Crp/Fnr family transcriptional regulator [Bacteroidota bacterium]